MTQGKSRWRQIENLERRAALIPTPQGNRTLYGWILIRRQPCTDPLRTTEQT